MHAKERRIGFILLSKCNIELLVCLILVLVSFFTTTDAQANNVEVSGVNLVSQNSDSGTVNVQFDLSWENSWKNNSSHDAVWVFVKYSVDSGSSWTHATLAASGTNPTGSSVGTGSSLRIQVPSDKIGAFIHRSEEGSGDVSATDLELVWDYEANGLLASQNARVKVFAIEMVYIPEGSFNVGDYSGSTASLKQGSSDTDPWSIVSEGSISVSNAATNGFYYVSASNASENSNGDSFTISSSYPKGYNDFYIMKHELTEGLYTSFFNTLSNDQKLIRDISSPTGKNSDATISRNTFSWTAGNATTSRQDRACSFLSWMDGAAFADWAGLRPMSELEFEKASRGAGVIPVSGEFAWGNTSLEQATTLSGSEDGSETITDEDANAHYGGVSITGGDGGLGPIRAGIFANSQTTRTIAGAGFYGALNLSDNLYERIVSVGNSQGRAFVASHGDGVLTSTDEYEGNATNTDWPGIDSISSRGITGALGSGFKGGNWSSSSTELRTSDRTKASFTDSSRSSTYGFRAVRTAP